MHVKKQSINGNDFGFDLYLIFAVAPLGGGLSP